MRNFKLFILIGALCITQLSCSDFLDIEPTSKYSNENLFHTVDQAEISIMGVYNQLLFDALYGRNVTMYYDMDTDLSQIGGGNSSGKPDGERRSLAHYAFDASTKQLENAWSAFYIGIERANIVIERVPQMALYHNGTESEKKDLHRIHGEALTIRAILYFDLVRLWGDVPYKREPSKTGENYDLPRTPRDIIYDDLVKDLTEAVDLVPWANEVALNERITKGAVKGILARVALHAAGKSLRWDLETNSPSSMKMATRSDESRIRELYTIARDQTKQIMEKGIHKLNPSFENIWKNICNYRMDAEYNENIFELGFYSRLGVRHEAGSYGDYNGPRSALESKFGKADAGTWVMPSFFLTFDPNDVRRDASIWNLKFMNVTPEYRKNKGQPTEFFSMTPAKWRKQWAPEYIATYTNFNYPMLRYADVLLMFAEADSWLAGKATEDAIDALKQVRKRAFPTQTAQIEAEEYPVNFEDFLEVIIQERAFELAFEGFRKADLIRWGKLAEKIAETKFENQALIDCFINGDANTPLKPYNGNIERVKGEQFPRYVYNRDSDSEYVEIVYSNPGSGWNRSNWLHSNFADGLAQYAIGFVENRSELYPISIQTQIVSPAISQLPTY